MPAPTTLDQQVMDTLASVGSELKSKHPSLVTNIGTLARDPHTHYIEFRDPQLERMMGDAYPTGMMGKFADILVTSRVVTSRDNFFIVFQDYGYGFKFPIDSPNNPKPIVEQIADLFAALIKSPVSHGHRNGRYAYSTIHKEGRFPTLEEVKALIMQDVDIYIKYNRLLAPAMQL